MGENFYLTLMSNSSLNYYPENKTSTFTVHLPQKIQLVGEWVVALAEIHYPYNFFNVTDGENNIYVELNVDEPHTEGELNSITHTKDTNRITQSQHDTFAIPPGFYKSVTCILKAVNTRLFELTECDVLSLDELNARTKINGEKCKESNIKVLSFSNRLALQLGFNPLDNILNFDSSPNIGNVYFGIPDRMLIYTDVIEPTFIGHEKAQIIKILNTGDALGSCKFGDVRSTEFHHMHYTPVLKKDFESISVDIRDCTGSFMPFRHGVSTVKLHFRKL